VVLVVYLETVILRAVVLLVVALIIPLEIPRREIMIRTGKQALNQSSRFYYSHQIDFRKCLQTLRLR
jgi:hypothetical protein